MNNSVILKLINGMRYYKENGGERSQKVGKILKRVIEIQNLLSGKFALVFITDKGIGKTSIINYMLDLMYEKEIKTKNGRKSIVYQDVLETGSGATTTAETEIIQSTSNCCEIEIVPCSKEEVDGLLRNFAKYIFKEIYVGFQGCSLIPPELFRAMRNMTGLKEEEGESKEKIDMAKELAKQYSEDNYLLFENEILRMANLEYRIKTEFMIEIGEGEKKSIRNISNNINLMNFDNIPLPRKVIVKLRKEIFDFDTLGCIDKIIDTRGLEPGVVATDRKDIRELFKKDKNKIVVLIDKFNSPSQSIIQLIDTYIQDCDYETKNRVSYLVNFKDGEPENVVSHAGKTYSELLGIETKREDIHKYIKGNNINLNVHNIIFTNPKRYLDAKGKILIDDDDLDDYGNAIEARIIKKDIREEKKRELWSDIYRITENYKKELIRELYDENEEFKSIKNKDIEELNLDFNRVIDTVNNFEMDDKDIKSLAFSIFEEYILSCHHSTLMALNNRFGIYSDRDVYLVGSDKIEKLFRNSLKDITIDVNNSILGQVTTEEEKKIVEFIISDINKYYKSFIDEIFNFIYEYLKNSIFNKEQSEFWKKSVGRWGKGSGYTHDISNYYKEQLEKEELDNYIDNATVEWVRTFKKGLITVLEDNM